MSKNKGPRNARTPQADEENYIVAAGAPAHYVSGYGRVTAGAVVSAPKGEEVSGWLVKVSASEAAKAGMDEDYAAELAAEAAEKVPDSAKSRRATPAAVASDADQSKELAKAKKEAEDARAEAEAAKAELAKVKKGDDKPPAK